MSHEMNNIEFSEIRLQFAEESVILVKTEMTQINT